MKILILIIACCSAFTGCAQPNSNTPATEQWYVSLTIQDIGNIETIMTIEPGKQADGVQEFYAYSPKNADRMVLGFWKSLMARWFSRGFEKGSILHIAKGKIINGDSLSGILTSSFSNYYINGKIKDGYITATLSDGRHKAVGKFYGDKAIPKLPLCDYPEICNTAIATTRSKIYDRSLLQTNGWRKFENAMKRVASKCSDDATFLMAFFYYSSQYLDFSHYNLFRVVPGDNSIVQAASNVALREQTKEIVYLKINSFSGGAPEIDSVFEQITAKRYKTLIVDLRDNTGGGIEAAMTFGRHLVHDTVYFGILLTQKYFATHKSLPPTNAYINYPHFSEANYALLVKGLSEQEGVCLVAYPGQPSFSGKVYVLTNSNTASTCEPIVYTLKQQKLATIVGEKTAGAMLSSEMVAVGNGYTLMLPVATYYTSDGVKLDQQGVSPDIIVAPGIALDTVLTLAGR